jgi:TonB family protein
VAFIAAKKHWLAIALSVAVHAALTATISWVAYRTLSAGPAAIESLPPTAAPDPTVLEVELPQVGEGYAVDEEPLDPAGEPPKATAGDAVAHPDTGRPGRGGSPTARAPAQNLADADERMRLSPDLLSRLDRDQVQRLRVARARVSWEDRRSTTHPAELTLVSSGPGGVRERRPPSPVEPSRGALRSPRASVRGASFGFARTDDSPGDRSPGGELAGSLDEAPGMGIARRAPGQDHRSSAPVANARPAAVLGPVAVPAADSARPRDNVDSEQEVATAIRSLVHASTAGGLLGEGVGGSAGGVEVGEGGPAAGGFRASPLGQGEGFVYDYWTRDPRLLPYFRGIHARIDPLWADAFPKSALLELKQGTTIIEFVVSSDGRVAVTWPPVRPSGIDEFDRNCADAIRRAGPFPPIPAVLGVTSLRIRAPFVANNPIVK